MHRLLPRAIGLLTLSFAPALLAAQGAADPDKAAKSLGPAPTGWSVRLDRPTAKREDIAFTTMGKGMHVTSGPAAIYWPAGAPANGAFTVTATIAQRKAPAHPEAYGLFIGGANLDQPTQEYLYFLVRSDGKYMVKHRAGADVHTVADWTDSPAVNKQNEAGAASNALSVVVSASSVTFKANGKDVATMAKADLKGFKTDGIAGIRVNHNLDVHIDGFAVTK
jgi:hypothetical protein